MRKQPSMIDKTMTTRYIFYECMYVPPNYFFLAFVEEDSPLFLFLVKLGGADLALAWTANISACLCNIKCL